MLKKVITFQMYDLNVICDRFALSYRSGRFSCFIPEFCWFGSSSFLELKDNNFIRKKLENIIVRTGNIIANSVPCPLSPPLLVVQQLPSQRSGQVLVGPASHYSLLYVLECAIKIVPSIKPVLQHTSDVVHSLILPVPNFGPTNFLLFYMWKFSVE